MRITVTEGDITTQDVDAIVNAANSTLLGGGGVDGAIHAAAGPDLLASCRDLRDHDWPDGLPAGCAAATPAGRLPADYVIHTVGPNKHAGQNDPEVLESCFRQSMEVAVAVGARTIAFPAIGAGVYGWEASEVAAAARRVFSADDPAWSSIEEVRFVLFSGTVLEAFAELRS